HLNLTASYTDPSALPRYRHHFRTIQVDWHQTGHLAALVEELPLTETRQTNEIELFNLKKLVLRSKAFFVEEYEMDAFVEVLSNCHNLTELDLPGDVLCHNADMVEYFLEKIEQLPNLQRLVLSDANVDAWVAHHLLKVCFKHPQLVDLQCDFTIADFRYPIMPTKDVCDPQFAILLKSLQDADNMRTDAAEPTGLRLKSLMLPLINGGYPQDFLFPFLRSHVPYLERLDMPCVHRDYDGRDLKDAILEGCPRLQHITANYFLGLGDGRCGINNVIRDCIPMGLRTFRGKCTCNDTNQGECQEVMQSLLDRHATTLEEFELWGCDHIRSIHLHSVLAKCRKLKSFRVTRHVQQGIAFQDALISSWICHDIQQLYLFFDRRFYLSPLCTVTHEAKVREGKEAYAQIGRLIKLEELGLGHIMGDFALEDLTLEAGWLGELAGLKELRHFHVLTDLWASMGQAEVEFMVTNWPKLEKISVDTHNDEYYVHAMLSKPHWQWLKEKWPGIVLTWNVL
ncbi:hypothetical protein BGX34_007672, partial [Mortierella sp. NVP85]